MRWKGPAAWASLLSLVLLTAACGSVVEPAGEGARSISSVWWLMFWLGLIPVVIVVGVLAAIVRGRTPRPNADRRFVLYGGVVLSSLLLAPVIVITAITQMNIEVEGSDRTEILLTGHQFWWEIEYIAADGESVRSANELHIPANTPVDLRLESEDVIHSVWIPEIHGKMDLIPGRVNELQIRAEEPGVYEGRCAEFCGLGHARMKLLVVAHPPDEYEAWLEGERAPAEVDVDTATLELFADGCAPCHTVRGLFDEERYEGDFGPDLTHLASRRMIGANILPNTPDALARWIIDPRGVKEGNRMPDVGLDAESLNSILELLDQLD